MFARAWVWFIFVCTLVTISLAQPAFVSEWKTDNVGVSSDTQITLPLENGGSYNFTVNWGDGNVTNITTWDSINKTHTYASAGTYEVNITGELSGWRFNDAGDELKIINISEWGPLNLGNNGSYFYGASYLLVSATDSLNITGTADMSYAFYAANALGSSLNNWDVSNVTNMSYMFAASAFSEDLDSWDVSNVTDMNHMFYYNSFFNQNLSGWNVSKVTDMSNLFFSATSFNSNISEWDVSSVTGMSNLFTGTPFNQNISYWDVSSVTDMSFLFNQATSFNQDLSNWNVSNVLDMRGMFNGSTAFNGTVSNWDVANVTDMSYLFKDAASFNLNLSSWDVSSVTIFDYAFDGTNLSTENYDGMLINWTNELVLQSNVVFGANNTKFSLDSAVRSARSDLIDSYNWTLDDDGISTVDLNSNVMVTLGGGSVNEAWISSATGDGGSLVYYVLNQSNDETLGENLAAVNISKYSQTVSVLLVVNNWSAVTEMYLGDDPDILVFDDQNASLTGLTSTSAMFYGAINLENVTISNTDNIVSMDYMFQNALSFNGDISGWDTSSVTTMEGMFYNATSFNQNIGDWDCSNVQFMLEMFHYASSFNGDINSWNVSGVMDMYAMFANANSFNQDLHLWDVSSVADITEMFSGATSFNGNISDWDVSSIDDLYAMFNDTTSFNQDISSWNVSSVTNMNSMFADATSFNQNLSGWDIDPKPTYAQFSDGATNWTLRYLPNFITPAATNLDATYEVNATTASYNFSLTFIEVLNATYTHNTITSLFCTLCEAGSAVIPLQNGVNQFTFNMTDSHGVVNSTNFNITFNLDSDGDTVVDSVDTDDDNDGIFDVNDSVTGNTTNIFSNGNITNVTVASTDNLSREYTGVQTVRIYENDSLVIEFDHNFSGSNLTLANIFVLKNNDTLLVRVGNDSITKDITFDATHLNQTGSVCVYDAPLSAFGVISSSCDQTNETRVVCDGSTQSGYTCDSQTVNSRDLFTITGLTHSGAQFCQEDWSYGSWSTCSSGSQTRTATDANSCGSSEFRAAVTNSCGDSGSSSGSSGSITAQTGETAVAGATQIVSRVIQTNLKANVVKNVTIPGKLPITNLAVLPNRPIAFVQFTLRESTPPAELLTPVYSYLDMTPTGVSTTAFDQVNVSFFVNTSWMTTNNIAGETIKLYRYVNDTWIALPTTVVTKGAIVYEFMAQSPGFSSFAISGEVTKKVLAEIGNSVQPQVEEQPAEAQTLAGTDDAPPNSDLNTNQGGSLLWLWIVLIIVIVSLVIGGVMIYLKSGKRSPQRTKELSLDVNPQLYAYYLKERAIGYSSDVIIGVIRQVGWRDIDIDKLLLVLKKNGEL